MSCLSDVAGLRIGHANMQARATGCSVVLVPDGACAAVDVRGAAPGTRETDLLTPGNLVEHVHAIALCGGSAFGLDAASGVVHWLEERGFGLQTGPSLVPIVPAAVLFDLLLGDARIRPDAQCGYAACEAAMQNTVAGPVQQGNVGAGSGAVVGKIFGLERAMRGGIGSASVTVGGATVGALVACNAVGDVRHPYSGQVLAGARVAEGVQEMLDAHAALLDGAQPQSVLAGTNTTIGVIATNIDLDKPRLQRLALAGHDGLARTITPVHTMSDGDTLFALSTRQQSDAPSMLLLAAMASEAVALAIVRAVLHAHPYQDAVITIPSAHWSQMNSCVSG
ncbi:P1 family peptidase [Lampropedia puyangensis]|uniref:P1 family peptidase n=1 Tax=Lampropedia puyangensis TaxID=1330072 RepID=A0A4S8FBH4_9BURK|nr:P1 family peptidase [Lampropedia puyangensis]THU04165.1 P1 family peptidase [Lampropedia puyangensis]